MSQAPVYTQYARQLSYVGMVTSCPGLMLSASLSTKLCTRGGRPRSRSTQPVHWPSLGTGSKQTWASCCWHLALPRWQQ